MPGARRIAVSYTVESFGLSIRRSCRLVGMWRATYAYQSKGKDDEVLRSRLRELAEQRRRFGCPRLHVMLKRDGLVINHKRTERIYREEGLSLRLKKRKKKAAVLRVMLPLAEHANQRWSMDFAADSTLARRGFRVLAIVDDYSRECPAIEVDSSIPGARVVDVLERLAEIRGLPEVITVDNGPEFTGKTLDEWAYRRGIKLNFIRPGKPVENAYAESFIGRLRDECLNENWFSSVKEARDIIETWRMDYNEVRPHSSLDNLSPREFMENTEKTLIHSGL
jgi:putative transposase